MRKKSYRSERTEALVEEKEWRRRSEGIITRLAINILKVATSFFLFLFFLGEIDKREKREVRGLKNERTDEWILDFVTLHLLVCPVDLHFLVSRPVYESTMRGPRPYLFLFLFTQKKKGEKKLTRHPLPSGETKNTYRLFKIFK